MSILYAKSLLFSGDVNGARELLLEMVSKNGDDASAWLLLAGIATRTSDWQLGVTVFSALTGLRPASALASSGLAQCLFQLAKYEEALAEIARFEQVTARKDEDHLVVLEEHRLLSDRIRIQLGGP